MRVGISTPKADPAGVYAFRTFELIESTGAAAPGSAASLKTRALQLTGGPNSPAPPVDRNVYGVMMAQGQADIFITYGMALVRPEVPAAQAFKRFVLGLQGRDLLAAHGFTAP